MSRCEVLTDPAMYRNGVRMLEAMANAAPMPVMRRNKYVGDCKFLLTYGLGHPERRPLWQAHVARGGWVIGFDLGYWRASNRTDELRFGRPMRLVINADHPQDWLDDRPPDRFLTYGKKLRNDYRPDGPIVIVGLGPKTNVMLNQEATTWEQDALTKVRKVYPTASIIYRPKREDGTELPNTIKKADGQIEEVLLGASLVVCRHSNVAIDACFANIPVVCQDGAATALYGIWQLESPIQPSLEERLRFLYNLAWWQWRSSEAKACWDFILQRIKERERGEHSVPSHVS